ncbi:VCBS repeat-containing protein [Algoriphagus lutimaris]|uniref:FG-GAP repeat domain-containing protein n=1 Tax=Algoriphagus lutimaris TaxID=613197 RepID=UPI00196AFD6C|nr:VCBS repeat-containing protein [Algoriphagus lutimaris]MBN3521856.1 VCBS repeat-containing protein [Algoriphagus lutimaris]
MNSFRLIAIYSLILLGAVFCKPISERKQPPPTLEQLASEDLNLNGEQLANAYCATCHLKPEPEILDKSTWKEKVLPDMRKRMGLYLEEDFGSIMPIDMDVPKGIYSEIPYINKDNWEKLEAYYLDNAPDISIPQADKASANLGIPGFEIVRPKFTNLYPDLVTLLRVEPVSGKLWLGYRFKSIFVLDPSHDFHVIDSIETETAPIDIHWEDDSNSFELLTIGMMDTSNDSSGVVNGFYKSGQDWVSGAVLENLKRPVSLEYADFNGDGILDKVVCEFGNHIGELSLFKSNGDQWEKVVLKNSPGARRVFIEDLDQDGDLDILALMTQANEGFFAFFNQGDGEFKEKSLLRFHPAFGSIDFQFLDINHDGLKDLILVNGDHGDLAPVLKNYHGVRIFLNEGDLDFEPSWFYPMYGASDLEVADFDQDGDLDIFVLSFFPDQNQSSKQNLLYFQQNGMMDFLPYAPDIEKDSHWLTMTKGDLGGDGDLDLVVGVFEYDDLNTSTQKTWSPILVFKNQKK